VRGYRRKSTYQFAARQRGGSKIFGGLRTSAEGKGEGNWTIKQVVVAENPEKSIFCASGKKL